MKEIRLKVFILKKKLFQQVVANGAMAFPPASQRTTQFFNITDFIANKVRYDMSRSFFLPNPAITTSTSTSELGTECSKTNFILVD